MKSSLASREVIADSVELTVRGHCYDALVGLAGCDKSLPGMMMAMLRLNVPSVFMYGGSILPGKFQRQGRDRGRRVRGGRPARRRQHVATRICTSWNASPARAAGACGGQFTANTMACVSEAIGLALPGSAGAPAPYEEPRPLGRRIRQGGDGAGRLNIRPRDIVTRKALENAAVVVAATGGSTNAGLHLPAIAHEAGIEFTMDDVVEIMRRTPYIADLKPGGKYVAFDVYKIGGIPVVIKALLDAGLLHGDCMTVTGKTMAENLEGRGLPADQDVIYPVEQADLTDRRRGRAEGQPGAGRRHREGRRHEGPALRGHRALLRQRGGSLPRRREPRLQGRRCHRHPLRRPEGRPGHARDALHHRGDLRPGHG